MVRVYSLTTYTQLISPLGGKMKRLMFVIAVLICLAGCTTMEVLDMIFDDDCIYRGTVVEVEHWFDKTTVTFESGKTIECQKAEWVEAGDWIEAREVETDPPFNWQQCEFSR